MDYRQFFSMAFCVALSAMPISSVADGFGLFSKHEELKSHVVVDAGDFEKVESSDRSIGSAEILKLNSNCFNAIGPLGFWTSGKKAGLVLVDKGNSIRLALIESGVGSIKVETVAVLQVACPTEGSTVLPLDPRQRLEELKRQKEALQRQLEQLRQRQLERERLRQ